MSEGAEPGNGLLLILVIIVKHGEHLVMKPCMQQINVFTQESLLYAR